VRAEQWKYIRYPDVEPPYEQLFDLAGDPHEEKNLAEVPSHQSTLLELRAKCDEYRRTLR
jgi:arylsulfatase A-like enzyme